MVGNGLFEGAVLVAVLVLTISGCLDKEYR